MFHILLHLRLIKTPQPVEDGSAFVCMSNREKGRTSFGEPIRNRVFQSLKSTVLVKIFLKKRYDLESNVA